MNGGIALLLLQLSMIPAVTGEVAAMRLHDTAIGINDFLSEPRHAVIEVALPLDLPDLHPHCTKIGPV
jgi:hypothetical protein